MINSTYIQNFCIVDKDGKGTAYEMSQAVEYIFINESLFNFHLLGFVTLIDSNNWLEKIAIDDTSLINMKLISPSSDNMMELTFRITGVSDIVRLDNNKKKYNVQFVSEEAYQNFKVRISKGYAGTSVAIFRDIMSKLSQKSVIVSKSNDDARLLVPNMHPYKAIDLLNLYGSDSCYDFLFWENFRGLNYNRVTELLNRKVIHNIYEKDLEGITEQEINKNPDYASDKNNIQNYYQSSNRDIITYLKEGTLGSTTYTFDSVTGEPGKFEVNPDYKESLIFHFEDNCLNYKNYPSRHKILNQLIEGELLLTLEGDFNRCTGDMCYVEITGRAQQPEFTSSLSGNFLIMRIQHEFNSLGYRQTLGITR